LPLNDKTIDVNWFANAFDDLYPVLYGHRSLEAAKPEAEFAAEVLSIHSQTRLLDLCCGTGRHLAHLSNCTAQLYGLDYSNELLKKACKSLGENARLLRADMRNIPFHKCFDVIVNFFTSFGYFLDMTENISVLRGIQFALKPGGLLFMDHINVNSIRKTLVPDSQRIMAGFSIEENRWIDEETHRVNKHTRIVNSEGVVQEIKESVRLFTANEISAYMSDAGLKVRLFFGDYTGAPLTEESPRMIIVAES